MYSTSVAGADGEPSTLPCWGIPSNRRVATPASGSVVTFVGVVDEELLLLPVTASTIAAGITASAISPATPAITFGFALRPPSALRTGGAAACWRRCRAFFALVMADSR